MVFRRRIWRRGRLIGSGLKAYGPQVRKNLMRRRKRLRIGRIIRPTQKTIYPYIRTCADPTPGDWFVGGVGGGTGNTHFTRTFSLNMLPNSSEFTNLYDQYRIDYVWVTLRRLGVSNIIPSDVSTQAEAGHVLLVIDTDDATALTTSNDYLQYMNCRILDTHKDYAFKVYPRPAIQMYNNGITTGYGNPGRQIWCDSGYPAIHHFGLKVHFPSFTTNNAVNGWEVFYKFKISFKNVR